MRDKLTQLSKISFFIFILLMEKINYFSDFICITNIYKFDINDRIYIRLKLI
jgi:hypothetical protein